MKRILITGVDSYIGTSFENWLKEYSDMYKVDTIDMRDDEWKQKPFGSYDVVYHVAAIVHIKENDKEKYYKVNRDLAIDVARKAKKEGVKQFIFLSTMRVYGMESGYIDKNTKLNPKTDYDKSKLEAEKFLSGINDENFKVAIIRPPIVYGKNCKGNYPRLAKLTTRMLVFPNYNNERSMIFIDNLSEFIRQVIEYKMEGLFFPQNREYVNTSELVQLVSEVHGRHLKLTKIFNPLVSIGIKLSRTFAKVFGTFVYDKNMDGGPDDEFDYETCSFRESIELTEK